MTRRLGSPSYPRRDNVGGCLGDGSLLWHRSLVLALFLKDRWTIGVDVIGDTDSLLPKIVIIKCLG